MANQTTVVRAIGRWSLAALMVNLVIGSGIFGLPAAIASLTGRQSPWVFVFAAAGVGVIAACFAELGSRVSGSGGPYLYARLAFGRFAGIQTGWLNWLSRVASTAAATNLLMVYLAEFWPGFGDRLIASVMVTVLLAGLTAVNVRGVRFGAALSDALAAVKLVPLIVVIALGCLFIALRGGHASALPHPAYGANGWLNAMLLAVFAYVGFEAALIPAGEVRHPDRDAPVAILAALAICTPIYVLMQLVVVQTVSNPASTVRPVLAAAQAVGGRPTAALVGIGVVLSILGFLTAGMITSPRVLFALAEQRDLPRWFAAVHARYKTPHVSIILFAVLVWALALSGGFAWNARLTAVSRLVTYGLSCAAVPMLRRSNTTAPRFQVPGGYILPFVGMAFCGLLVSRIGAAEILILAITAAVASLNWVIVRRCSHDAARVNHETDDTSLERDSSVAQARA